MAAAKRELTMQDVGAIMARSAQSADPKEVYRAVERMAADTIGWRLFTVLRYVEAAQAVERVYSSDEKAYPSAAASHWIRSRPATAPWRGARCFWPRPRRTCARPSLTTS
jgi:hypothetical protein